MEREILHVFLSGRLRIFQPACPVGRIEEKCRARSPEGVPGASYPAPQSGRPPQQKIRTSEAVLILHRPLEEEEEDLLLEGEDLEGEEEDAEGEGAEGEEDAEE